MTDKLFVSPQNLLIDSFKLAKKIMDSGYKPNFIVAIWRGGTPVGMAIQEFFSYHNIEADHIAIKTSAYGKDIGTMKKKINVNGIGYIVKKCNSEDKLLIIDDVYDTGLSINEVITKIKQKSRKNTPQIKVATVYYKPVRNKTDTAPDFYMHETEKWIVFPHELEGLSIEEISRKGFDIEKYIDNNLAKK